MSIGDQIYKVSIVIDSSPGVGMRVVAFIGFK